MKAQECVCADVIYTMGAFVEGAAREPGARCRLWGYSVLLIFCVSQNDCWFGQELMKI